VLKFGLVSVFPPAAAALNRLRLAEELGFDYFWVCDSHVIWNECYTLLGWLVANGRRSDMRFGTMVTNPASRDPIVIASAFATLNQISGGRVECGIGRGDSAVRVLNRRPSTVAETEAGVSLIRTLGSGRSMAIDGATVQIDWADGGQLPVHVAAYGPRMFEVAGRVGDGVIFGCADLHYIAWALTHVRRGAEQAGRDLKDLAVMCCTAIYISEDINYARDQVRSLGAVIGNQIADVLRNSGAAGVPAELAAMVQDRGEYDYLRHMKKAAHADYVSDDIVDRLCIVGTATECVQRLTALADAGVTHMNFLDQQEDFDGQMRTFAREVMPSIRRQVLK
jgi:probable F420-dependent oxidoreductase